MRRHSTAFLAFASLLLLANCSSKTTTPGQLLLAIQSDVSLPDDVDKVEVTVSSFGVVRFSNEYEAGPGGIKIPATLAVVAGKDTTAPVSIKVTAKKRGVPRVLREVVTTIPQERAATLRVPLQWTCFDDRSIDRKTSTIEDVVSACGQEGTCIAGSCAPKLVDSKTLPSYAPEDIFGGGTGSGDGTCFKTLECFGGGVDVTSLVDGATCSFPLSVLGVAASDHVNVALSPVKSSKAGICSSVTGECFVPLDQDDLAGFRIESGLVKLPKGVCQGPPGTVSPLAAGDHVIASPSRCSTKLPSVPTCGPWSSAATNAVDTPGAPVVTIDGSMDGSGVSDVQGDVLEDSKGSEDVAEVGTQDDASDGAASDGDIQDADTDAVVADVAVETGVDAPADAPEDAVLDAPIADATPDVSAPDASVPLLVASSQSNPTAIAVSASAIYWGTDNDVSASLLVGGIPQPRTTFWPGAGAKKIDVSTAIVAWSMGNEILQCAESGCGAGPVQVLGTFNGPANSIATDGASIYAVDVSGTLVRCTTAPACSPAAPAINNAREVIYADQQLKFLWTDTSLGTGNASFFTCSGSCPGGSSILKSGLMDPKQPRAGGAGGSLLFWLTGTLPTVTVNDCPFGTCGGRGDYTGNVEFLTAAEEAFYFSTPFSGTATIYGCLPLPNCTPTFVASSNSPVTSLTTDPGFVYFTNTAGEVWRVAKPQFP